MDATRFGRERWRRAIRPAHGATLEGARLVCPRGLVADRVLVADTPMNRLRGLIGRTSLRDREAMVISPCAQVHTMGLHYPIDAVFCDRDLRVLKVFTLAPRRLTRHVRHAACCIELPAGRAAECGIEPGTQLEIEMQGTGE